MASYRGHLMLSAPLGAGYGALALWRPEFDWGAVFLGAGLTTVGGLLPDLDSDSGVPVRELFGVLAAATAVLMYHPLHDHLLLPVEQSLAFMALGYLFVRYVFANIFRKMSVHRGMYHSIPAMLISGLLVFHVYPSSDLQLRLYLAGGVMVGFLSHLVLDELYSVDFMGVRIRFNKFAGSALKFASPSKLATLSTYLILFVLLFLTFLGMPGWAKLPEGWHAPEWLCFDKHAHHGPQKHSP